METQDCEAAAMSCVCALPAANGHEVHECACGGQWRGQGDDWEPVKLPERYVGPEEGRAVAEAQLAAMDMLWGDIAKALFP